MREGEQTTALSRVLRQQNALVIPFIAGKYTPKGIPDRYISHRFWRGWIEFKSVGYNLTVAQRQYAQMLIDRGENVAGVWFSDRNHINNLILRYPILDEIFVIVQPSNLLSVLESLCKT